MSNVGKDGAPGIFWQNNTNGWAVNFRVNGQARRAYLTGQPVDPAERRWPLKTIAAHVKAILPRAGMFVLAVSRGGKLDGSITIVNGKVTSAQTTATKAKIAKTRENREKATGPVYPVGTGIWRELDD